MEGKIKKSDGEWREQLSAEQYRVAREGGTERPFSGEHYRQSNRGKYHCICCGALLFESERKFDAGCGWPSFWAEAAGANIQRIRDGSHGMIRVEVRCSSCEAHLGHVFPDGPLPSGERYCINSVSIEFRED